MAYLQTVSGIVSVTPGEEDIAIIRLSQNENGRQLIFNIAVVEGDIPEDSTAVLTGTKPDGVIYSTTGTVDGNSVTVYEDAQMTAVSGKWFAKLRITNSGNVLATHKIQIEVDPDTVSGGGVPSESQLDGLVTQAQVGDLDDLETTDKSSIVAAINEAAQGGGGGGGVSPYTSNPSALGTASAGSSSNYSRGDHVHPMPSASDVGALPSSTTYVASVNSQTGAVVIDNATTSASGLMSATDKGRLDDLYADYSSALTALGVI